MSFSLYTDFQESEVPVLKVKIEDELTIYEASQFKEKIDLILQNSATVFRDRSSQNPKNRYFLSTDSPLF